MSWLFVFLFWTSSGRPGDLDDRGTSEHQHLHRWHADTGRQEPRTGASLRDIFVSVSLSRDIQQDAAKVKTPWKHSGFVKHNILPL